MTARKSMKSMQSPDIIIIDDAKSKKSTKESDAKSKKSAKEANAKTKSYAKAYTLSCELLQEAIEERVKHQSYAAEIVSCSLKSATNPPLFAKEDTSTKPRIISMIFAGPSGCGKTEMVDTVRDCVGSDVPFINIDCSTFIDETVSTRVTGASAGFEGCQDKNFVDELADTLIDPEKIRIESNKKVAGYKDIVKKYNKKIESEPYSPPLILIKIDEIDKANKVFLLALNGLLDHGNIKSARGSLFNPPRTTTLLFIFTSNYADNALTKMTTKYHGDARELIINDMKAHGLRECTIARFGHIIPFFALTKNETADILKDKLTKFQKIPNRITLRYALSYDAKASSYLLKSITQNSNPERGIRDATNKFFFLLSTLIEQAYGNILSDTSADINTFTLFYDKFNIDGLGHVINHELQPILNHFIHRSTNQSEIQAYCRQHLTKVKALGIRSKSQVYCYKIIPPPIVINITITSSSGKDKERICELEKENAALRKKLELKNISFSSSSSSSDDDNDNDDNHNNMVNDDKDTIIQPIKPKEEVINITIDDSIDDEKICKRKRDDDIVNKDDDQDKEVSNKKPKLDQLNININSNMDLNGLMDYNINLQKQYKSKYNESLILRKCKQCNRLLPPNSFQLTRGSINSLFFHVNLCIDCRH